MGIFDWLLGKKPAAANTPVDAQTAGSPSPPVLEVSLADRGIGLGGAIGDFGLDLGRGCDENLVCSSYSIYEAWLRVWAGSVGGCRTELDTALGVSDESEVQAALTALHAAIDESQNEDCVVESANALFVRPGLTIRDAFESAWGGSTREVDFADATRAADAVNGWVAEHTHEMIQEIVNEQTISSATALMIANAIYLKAKWADPFEQHATWSSPFECLDGSRRDVPTMAHMSQYRCARTADFELLRKPYRGGGLEMLIVLPAAGRFEVVRDRLAYGALDVARLAASPLLTTLFLPKFSIESAPEVDPLIRARGAEAIYSQSAADVSAMTPDARNPGEEIFVSHTAHRARIDVDEEGTEAAAATVVEMLAGAAPPKPYVFRVDRPFLYFVIDCETGTPLFSGQVVELATES